VLDLNLPRVSGLEVLQQIRNSPDLRALPVVILTSSEAERDITASYARGANSYVSKPVDLRQFQEAIAGIEEFWLVLAKLPGLKTLTLNAEGEKNES
jgi:CheY-like chemotaxis protein